MNCVFLVPELKVDVGEPVLVFRLPFHPSFEDRPTAAHVPQRLLHVGVLQPELVGSRQQRHGSIPQVSSVVHL